MAKKLTKIGVALSLHSHWILDCRIISYCDQGDKQANRRQSCSMNGVEMTCNKVEFPEICPLKGGYYISWILKKVPPFVYERCPLTRVYKCRALEEKSPGPQFGVR